MTDINTYYEDDDVTGANKAVSKTSGQDVGQILLALQNAGFNDLQESDIVSFSENTDDNSLVDIQIDHKFTETQLFPELKERIDVNDLNAPGTSNLSIKADDLNAGYQTTATFTMVESGAGFNNTLGAYTIGDDGSINAVEFAFTNVKDGLTNRQISRLDKRIANEQKKIDRIEAKDSISDNDQRKLDKYENNIEKWTTEKSELAAKSQFTYNIDSGNGDELGMFIIANGDRINKGYDNLDLENGTLEFIFDLGGANERTAQITDSAADISLIHTLDGVVTEINGNIYHATERGAPTDINPDDAQHAVSGLVDVDNTDTLRIGFEDLKNLGDADFNDVVFDVTINEIEITIPSVPDIDPNQTITGNNSSEVIVAGTGDDVIFGEGGDDTINGRAGRDILYGGAGADSFILQQEADGVFDIVRDFNAAEGDALDVTQFIVGFYAATSNIADFIRITDNGIDSVVRIAANGDRDFSLIVARLDGVTGLDVFDLYNNGGFVITGDETINGTTDNEILYGGDGDDTLFGNDGDDTLFGNAGDDVLYGGVGRDILQGDAGADTFVFDPANPVDLFDVVRDFDASEGDVIDLTSIITGFTPGTSNIADFVRITEGGGNSFVRVDGDGGRDDFSTIVMRLDGVTGLDVFDLFNDGSLAVTGDNTLNGTDDADSLFGFDGDDVFTGGLGRDSLTGGSGADTFTFIDTVDFDLIRDFNAGEGDILDITSVIDGFDPVTDAIEDFVLITQGGANSFVRIDADGAANGQDFTTIVARLDGTTDLDAVTLYQDGNILI